ncbi:hypothetical protein ACFE04_027666 [Oxalis oulophora]
MAMSGREHGCCSNMSVLRLVVVLVMSVFFLAFFVKPWRTTTSGAAHHGSCTVCDCHCALQSDDDQLSLPFELVNSSYADCGKNDPDMDQELQKDVLALLSEELALQQRVANESLGRARALTIDSKRAALHYRKEAEKCNSGVEICEEARERAERELVEERRLTALWEKRARENGWIDSRRVRT